jgi:hypothetical protein
MPCDAAAQASARAGATPLVAQSPYREIQYFTDANPVHDHVPADQAGHELTAQPGGGKPEVVAQHRFENVAYRDRHADGSWRGSLLKS